jgi:hypothetical protein
MAPAVTREAEEAGKLGAETAEMLAAGKSPLALSIYRSVPSAKLRKRQ